MDINYIENANIIRMTSILIIERAYGEESVLLILYKSEDKKPMPILTNP
jgi:hypothetical protein